MYAQIRTGLVILGIFTLLTGFAYPLVVTGIGQMLVPYRANGSLIKLDGQVVGSELIGQYFTDPKYFWGRPSATVPDPYNASASSGSNLGPSNPALEQIVRERVMALRSADPANELPIPADLVTASASGLDPHISVAAALYQAHRVAEARGVTEAQIRLIIAQHTVGRQMGVLGEPRVNVFMLNLALDGLQYNP